MHPTLGYLLNALDEAVVIVSAGSYNVKYVNSPGRRFFGLKRGEPVEDSRLIKQLSVIEHGYLDPPVDLEVDLAGDDRSRARVTFLKSPTGDDLIIFAKYSCSETIKPDCMAGISALIDCEMRYPIKKLMAALNDTMSRLEYTRSWNLALFYSVSQVFELYADVEEVMKKIEFMASCFETTPLLASDRIPAFELIQKILSLNESLIQDRSVRISFAGVTDDLPVLYGSKKFLVQALAGYLRRLILEADKGERLQITANTTHAFLLLSIENYGKTPVTLKSTRSDMRVGDFISRNVSKTDPALDLSLMLCKRVIELHGGMLRYQEHLDGLTTVRFELPVGAPILNDRDLGIKQAQRYAQDLMQLIKTPLLNRTEGRI